MFTYILLLLGNLLSSKITRDPMGVLHADTINSFHYQLKSDVKINHIQKKYLIKIITNALEYFKILNAKKSIKFEIVLINGMVNSNHLAKAAAGTAWFKSEESIFDYPLALRQSNVEIEEVAFDIELSSIKFLKHVNK